MAIPRESIRNRKLGETVDFAAKPYCIYFYYIGLPGESVVVRHYYSDEGEALELEDAKARAIELTLNARLDLGEQDPQPNGANWQGIEWRRKSWIVIVIDLEGYRFVGDGLVFTAQGQRNHSFFDSEISSIEVDGDSRSALFLVNHMKRNRAGTDLEDEHQDYFFKLTTEPVLPRPIRDPDDGGMNLGPPVPPPA